MENKNIEFSVDPREYQMTLIMNLPKNTPKAAMKVIREIQKERDCLLKQNEELKQNQLTEDSAMEYVYENSGQYEDWVEGSDLYISLQKKNKDLADFAEASVHGFEKLNAEINGLKEIEKKFHIYCEILDTDPDGWEDMIGEAGYTRNEDGMIVEKEEIE